MVIKATFVMVLLIAAASAVGQSGQPPNRQRMPETSPAVEGQAANAAKAGQYPTEAAPFPVRVIESASDAARSKVREANADKHDAEDLDAQVRTAQAAEEQVRIGYFVAALSFCGTVLLFFTLVESRRAAGAAIDSATIARSTAERQLRAYVFVDAMEVRNFSVTDRVEPALTIKNFGQTPAQQVTIGCVVSISDGHIAQPIGMLLPAMIPPGSHMLYNAPLNELLSEQDFQGLVSGKTAMWLHGVIKYRDVFDCQRETKFLYYWRGNGTVPTKGQVLALSTAESGNEAT